MELVNDYIREKGVNAELICDRKQWKLLTYTYTSATPNKLGQGQEEDDDQMIKFGILHYTTLCSRS